MRLSPARSATALEHRFLHGRIAVPSQAGDVLPRTSWGETIHPSGEPARVESLQSRGGRLPGGRWLVGRGGARHVRGFRGGGRGARPTEASSGAAGGDGRRRRG